jgi:hypothetical protein
MQGVQAEHLALQYQLIKYGACEVGVTADELDLFMLLKREALQFAIDLGGHPNMESQAFSGGWPAVMYCSALKEWIALTIPSTRLDPYNNTHDNCSHFGSNCLRA